MWIRSHILQPTVGVLTVQNTQHPKRVVGPENDSPVFDTCSRAQKASSLQHPACSLRVFQGLFQTTAHPLPLAFALDPTDFQPGCCETALGRCLSRGK